MNKLLAASICIILFTAQSQVCNADPETLPPAPPFYIQSPASLKLVANNLDRDNFNIIYIHSDGRFAVFQHDRILFDNLHVHDEKKNWKNTPINFVHYDGHHTLINSYEGSPTDTFVETKLNTNFALGDSIHVKAVLWPYLEQLFQIGKWEITDGEGYSLFIDSISTKIDFDDTGKIQVVSMIPSPNSSTKDASSWIFTNYQATRDAFYPTNLTQRYLLKDNNDNAIIDETAHYSLNFTIDPNDFEDHIAFDNSSSRMDRYDLKTNDVYTPEGDFRYNAEELKSAYYRAVGIRNPTRTRNILYAIIAVLGLVSIIVIWKKKTA